MHAHGVGWVSCPISRRVVTRSSSGWGLAPAYRRRWDLRRLARPRAGDGWRDSEAPPSPGGDTAAGRRASDLQRPPSGGQGPSADTQVPPSLSAGRLLTFSPFAKKSPRGHETLSPRSAPVLSRRRGSRGSAPPVAGVPAPSPFPPRRSTETEIRTPAVPSRSPVARRLPQHHPG